MMSRVPMLVLAGIVAIATSATAGIAHTPPRQGPSQIVGKIAPMKEGSCTPKDKAIEETWHPFSS
jgi:hypothetical protein